MVCSPDGRRTRHGRYGWLRQNRGRRERTCVPRSVGGARPRYAASHDLRRCLAYRPSALRAGTASASYLSERVVLPALSHESALMRAKELSRLRQPDLMIATAVVSLSGIPAEKNIKNIMEMSGQF